MLAFLFCGDILINGFFHEGEWVEAQNWHQDGVHIRVASDEYFIYLAVFEPDVSHTGIDLFISQDNQPVRRFHVSAALSEATWLNGEWVETWERNLLWTANKIGLFMLNGERKTGLPTAFEFQFSRKLLGENPISIAIHLKRPEKKMPPSGHQAPIPHWLRIERF